MITRTDPPGNKRKKILNKEKEVTARDVENTVPAETSEDLTTTGSEQIVNEQSQDQAVNNTGRSEENDREEFLD